MTRHFILAFLVVMFLPAFARAEPVLTMWGPGLEKSVDSAGFDAEVKVFESRCHCRLRRLDMGAGHMDAQKLLTAIAGGVPPELVRQGRFNIGDFAARDAFQSLDDLIARDRGLPDGVRVEQFYPAAWNEAVYRGHAYAIPDNIDGRALYYNKSAFRAAGLDPNKPPRTWEELKADAVKLTRRDADGNFTQIGYMPNYGNVWLYMYSWQNGGEFMSPDGQTCTLANPYTTEALAYMVDLYKVLGGHERVDAFASGFQGDALDPFLTGQVAMKVDGNWTMDSILRYGPGLDFAVAPAPVPSARLRHTGRFAGQPDFITWSGGFSWVIPRGISGARKELAWRFIKFDESLEGQRIRFAAQRAAYLAIGRRFVPEMRANRVANTALLREFVPAVPRVRAGMDVFMRLMPNARYRPVTFVGQRLWDEHVRATDAATRGMDPHAALLLGQLAVQKELDRARVHEAHPEVPASAMWGIAALAALLVLAGLVWVLWRFRGAGRNTRTEALAAYLFAAPWIVGFIVFTLGPLITSMLLSFCEYDVLHSPRWLGLLNYHELLTSAGDGPLVIKSFGNVLYMSAIGVPVTMGVGLGIALLLNARVRGMQWYRTAFYLPSITPVVSSALLWIWLFNTQHGLIDAAWTATLTRWFGLVAPNWLADVQWVKPAYILMGLWGAGSGMILWLAGLQGIPQHLYEAAELDGAGVWSKFRNVMLPLLTPTIFFVAVMGVIGSLQIFEIAYIMRGADNPLGYPADSTMMPVVLLFQNAFQYFKMGYASALAWILFVVILAITLVQLRLSSRWVHYGE